MRLRVDSRTMLASRCLVALAAAASPAGIAACSGAPAPRPASTPPASAPSAPAVALGPVYRFVATGGYPEHTVEQADGSVAVVDRRRTLVRTDGTVLSAPAAGMGGIQLPARLGGGYLFWQEQLAWAPTFLADPIPFARLQTNVIDVMFGHDSLLVFGPKQGRRAYSVDPPRRVPLSPHGVVAIGGANDNRVLAVDAAGRARVSTDGGKTWTDAAESWIAHPRGVLGLPGDVAFVLGKNDGAWLRPDGSFERRPLPGGDRNTKSEPSPGRQLYAAALNGRRGPGGQVLLADKNQIVEVDLATGAVSAARSIAPEGATCYLHSTAGDGVATCNTYSVHGRDAFDVIGHAIGTAPSVEKSFAHHPTYFAFGTSSLAVVAPCGDSAVHEGARGGGPTEPATMPAPPDLLTQSSGTGNQRAVCVRAPNGTWTEYDADAVVGPPWIVMSWLGREGGAPSAIVWEQGVRGREPRTGIVDMERHRFVVLDKNEPAISSARGRWTVAPDGSIHGFTPTGTIAIDPSGHVTHGARTFHAVVSAGDHALARDDQWHLWQTTDGGAHWLEVARPPVDMTSGETVHFEAPGLTLAGMMCGELGCTIQHPSGFGTWVRSGWPNDPPNASDAATRAPEDAAAPASAAPAPSAPVREAPTDMPKLVCTLREELKPKAEARMTGSPFRDEFQAPDDGYEGSAPLHALRAVLALGTPQSARNVVDARYVETFDPTGRIRRASGSLGPDAIEASKPVTKAPGPSLAPSARPNRHSPATTQSEDFDEVFKAARPVLSAGAPGQAAGVIIFTDGRPVWISPSGAIRRVARCAEQKQIFGGVVDAAGKLSIACGDYSRAVDVIDAETGRVQFALPAILPWVWQPEVALPLYGGGRATFLPNPDAIARDASGKLGVLRLPSAAPASEDDPAWFLSPDAPPIELAPWSKVEAANSPACGAADPDDNPVRALIQTAAPWVAFDGAPGFPQSPGMTAIVRWGRRRICVEALEVGYEKIERGDAPRYGAQVMAVARFVGAGAGAGLVGMSEGEAYRVPATCELETAAP